jgi:hypothetical protein|tara:strand:+ start:724 stop:1365 length:642 start_codon:yes stop_codon:yes gene_type:complete
MALSLKESCKMFEKFNRQQQKTTTFEEFNALHGTCLPKNDSVYTKFMRNLHKAKKSEGIPVTRRLMSLFDHLSSGPQVIATPAPQAQIPMAPPTILSGLSLQNKIRTPEQKGTILLYGDLLSKKSGRFVDKKGLMVHFVEPKGIPMLSNTCKLSKLNAKTLFNGKGNLTMRNNIQLQMESMQVNKEDYEAFIVARRSKKAGPYFLRVNYLNMD